MGRGIGSSLTSSGIPMPIMPTENIGMMSGAIRKHADKRRDQRGSRRGRRFSKVTQFDGSTKVDTGKIMSKEEYEADATKRINEGIKRGIQMSPEPYSMYLERQKKKQDGSTPKIGIGDFEQNQAEKINEAIAKQQPGRDKFGRPFEPDFMSPPTPRPTFDPNKPSAVQETTRVNVQDPTLGGPPEREVPLPKEKDMTPRGPAPFAPNEGNVAMQRFFETMFERAANRKERSGIDRGEMMDRQKARRDEAAMRDSERGSRRNVNDAIRDNSRRNPDARLGRDEGGRGMKGRRMRRRDFTRRRPEARRSREERAAFRDRYVSTLGRNFFS